MNSQRGFRPGPAIMVTAAFIGPGTVMTASKAGADFGFALLWAVAFSVVTAIVLQEMAARLGIVSGKGLAHAIQSAFTNSLARWSAIALVLGAILFGNTAYQTGNLLGAAAGMQVLTTWDSAAWAIAIAVVAASIILTGRFAVIQWALTALVSLMGLVFLMAAVFSGPQLSQLISGFKFSIPEGSGWLTVALIGTTVVPYNLFLHASAAAMKYESEEKDSSIRYSFYDTVISIVVGGLITAALLVTAAITFADGQELSSVKDIAKQLRPSLGAWAERAFAMGLFAAGLTSSITAPIAAAYATAGCLGWEPKLSNPRLKVTALIVIAIGLGCAIQFGSSPKETIIIAQAANGLLLPIVAVFLLFSLNRSAVMGEHKNGLITNLLSLLVVATTVILAAQQFHSVWNKLADMLSG